MKVKLTGRVKGEAVKKEEIWSAKLIAKRDFEPLRKKYAFYTNEIEKEINEAKDLDVLYLRIIWDGIVKKLMIKSVKILNETPEGMETFMELMFGKPYKDRKCCKKARRDFAKMVNDYLEKLRELIKWHTKRGLLPYDWSEYEGDLLFKLKNRIEKELQP